MPGCKSAKMNWLSVSVVMVVWVAPMEHKPELRVVKVRIPETQEVQEVLEVLVEDQEVPVQEELRVQQEAEEARA